MSPDEHYSASRPRVVLITRPTRLEQMLATHSTRGQARFYMTAREQSFSPLEAQHQAFEEALRVVQQAIPADQRRTRVDRDALDRFLFAPDDLVIVVGQDGLVANVAKYLRGQLAAGINPDPASYEGVLCQHSPEDTASLLAFAEREGDLPGLTIEERAMAQVQREDGQQLLALNEVFVGHRTHQSARYQLVADGRAERQSSSGLIVSTGTGATGWARSIAAQRGLDRELLPRPHEQRLSWFVREPWPSLQSGTELNFGLLEFPEQLQVSSEMGDGGVVFADGIESDRLEFLEGHEVSIGVAEHRLRLIARTDAIASVGRQLG